MSKLNNFYVKYRSFDAFDLAVSSVTVKDDSLAQVRYSRLISVTFSVIF
jgi:hypothetical protein